MPLHSKLKPSTLKPSLKVKVVEVHRRAKLLIEQRRDVGTSILEHAIKPKPCRFRA